MAFDVMRISLEGLIKTINSVKPHYFDSSSKPYIRNGCHFCNAYWRFLALTEEAKKMHNKPLEFAQLLKSKIPELFNLVPDLVELKRIEIREQLQSLETISKQVETYILRFQNYSLLKIAV